MPDEAPLPYDWVTILGKVLIVVALGYAIFVVALCPCKVLLACHIPFFLAAIAVAVVVCILFNLPWKKWRAK